MRYFIAAAGLAVVVAVGVGFSDEGRGAGGAKRAEAGNVRELASAAGRETGVHGRSVAELRKAGPAGLRAILAVFDAHPGTVTDADIDAVAGQRDARWSRLYWYTDVDAAKSAARAEHKPILYLRMLGKLTDEYSCANSRFFRTVLYANQQVSELLRERYVLVWQSERPVPVVTIDYGDGRVLKRTVTGNSIHYVLDAAGNVVDALPGLYDPETFTLALYDAADSAASGAPVERRNHLEQESAALNSAWEGEMGGPVRAPIARAPRSLAGAKVEVEGPVINAAAPNARGGMDRAPSKGMIERPIVKAVAPIGARASTARSPALPNTSSTSEAAAFLARFQPAAPDARAGADSVTAKRAAELPIVQALVPARPVRPMPDARQAGRQADGKSFVESPIVESIVPATMGETPAADSPVWAELAERRMATTYLDARSIELIRSQNPKEYAAPGALERVVEQFRRSIAADTVRNEYLFRRQILGWLMSSARPMALEDLNRRVYAELFLTPRSDPWLGLRPEATYSALCGDGCGVK